MNYDTNTYRIVAVKNFRYKYHNIYNIPKCNRNVLKSDHLDFEEITATKEPGILKYFC